MNIQQTEFLRFIKLLSDNDCLQHVVLIGSWTEYLYMEAKLLPGFEPNIRTLDVDFLIKNMRKPVPAKNLVSLAKADGYLIDKDVLSGTTKIFNGQGLEIEFLIQKVGAGIEHSINTNLGVTAQTLRHMNILLKNIIVLNYLGMEICVPTPEAYVLHKMVIHGQRGRKQEKDRLAIRRLWNHVNLSQLKYLYDNLTKKETVEVNRFMEDNGLIF